MIDSEILPLFTSEYTIGRSILTIEEAGEITNNAPVSILSIAQKHNLNPTFIIEGNLSSYEKIYRNFEKINRQFVFGLKLVVVSDITDKSPESLSTESKIVILFKNSNSYKDCIKIFNKAATEGKYYVPRTCWKTLNSQWTDNLLLAIPFYDGFIHANLLQNKTCVPDFPTRPIHFVEDHCLPFDFLIQKATNEYCLNNKNETVNTHSIYYYNTKDVKAYQTFRCIHERTTLAKPNLEYFGSDLFSFESYLNVK